MNITKPEAKKLATDFFFWWWNQPGTNTMSGFDDWWELQQKNVIHQNSLKVSEELQGDW